MPPTTITRAEFRADPIAATNLATKVGTVMIVDDNGKPLSAICAGFVPDDEESLRERLGTLELRTQELERALDEWRTAALVAQARADELAARLAEVET